MYESPLVGQPNCSPNVSQNFKRIRRFCTMDSDFLRPYRISLDFPQLAREREGHIYIYILRDRGKRKEGREREREKKREITMKIGG